MWSKEFSKFDSFVENDRIVFVTGTVDRRKDAAELVISKVFPIDEAESVMARGLVLTFDRQKTEELHFQQLHDILKNYPGNLEVYFEMLGFGGINRAIYRAGHNVKVNYDATMIGRIRSMLGDSAVRVLGPGGITPSLAKPSVPTPTEPANQSSDEWEVDPLDLEMQLTADDD